MASHSRRPDHQDHPGPIVVIVGWFVLLLPAHRGAASPFRSCSPKKKKAEPGTSRLGQSCEDRQDPGPRERARVACSEDELDRQLRLTRVTRDGRLAEVRVRRRATQLGSPWTTARPASLSVDVGDVGDVETARGSCGVEHVQHVEAQLDLHVLVEPDVLVESEVRLEEPGAFADAAAGGSDRADWKPSSVNAPGFRTALVARARAGLGRAVGPVVVGVAGAGMPFIGPVRERSPTTPAV